MAILVRVADHVWGLDEIIACYKNEASVMEQIEHFMNWMTDMDWGWWPVVRLRPQKERDIDNKVLLQISPIYGTPAGLLLFFLFSGHPRTIFTLIILPLAVLVGWGLFFITYKSTFAYFWNRRASRLRSAPAVSDSNPSH